MLVLTRRPGESLLIFPADDIDKAMTVAELFRDGPIEVHLRDIKANQVRLGIEAPKALAVLRDELEPKR